MQIGSAHLFSAYLFPQETTVQIASQFQQIAAADPNRVAIGFATSNATAVYVSTKSGNQNNAGWNVSNAMNPVMLTWDEWFTLVQQSWFMGGPALGFQMTVFTLTEKVGQ